MRRDLLRNRREVRVSASGLDGRLCLWSQEIERATEAFKRLPVFLAVLSFQVPGGSRPTCPRDLVPSAREPR